MGRVGEFFTREEFECHGEDCCKHSLYLDPNFIADLDGMRRESGGAINVSSGYRCEAHNQAIGGVASSWHTLGRAADCTSDVLSLEELEALAKKHGFAEVIRYDDFVHIAENTYGLKRPNNYG